MTTPDSHHVIAAEPGTVLLVFFWADGEIECQRARVIGWGVSSFTGGISPFSAGYFVADTWPLTVEGSCDRREFANKLCEMVKFPDGTVEDLYGASFPSEERAIEVLKRNTKLKAGANVGR